MVNQIVRVNIERLSSTYNIPVEVLEEFVEVVIKENKRKKKELTLGEIKNIIYAHFEVSYSTTELRKNKRFKMATEGMTLRLNETESWKKLYRKFIGILPGEEYEKGEECINGVNIFKYFHPWRVLGLDAKTASKEDIKEEYRKLSKVYHPDVPETGNSRIFEKITQMYKSLLA